MSKTKKNESALYPIGSLVNVPSLKASGKIKGIYLGRNFTEYTVQVTLGGKVHKMFFKEDELEAFK